MGKLQEQLNTGKRVNRPSDDPVVVIKSLGYKMQVDKVDRFQKNLGEVNNWLDSSDDALDGVGQVLHRAKELVTQAASDTMTPEDRGKVKLELEQLQKQLYDFANTKVGDKYIFSGTMTDSPIHNGTDFVPASTAGQAFDGTVSIEVFDGVNLNVNTKALETFREIDASFEDMKTALNNNDFGNAINAIDGHMEQILIKRAEIGARTNRADLMHNRLEMQEGAAKKQRSENEDVHYEKAITELITQESIHRAALSVGGRIIQPSLVDFLR